MLETLKIANLALIDNAVVNFNNGFNVLTGETGAGKSLLVDALLFLTGIRADKTLIKSGCDFARVEGFFSVDTNNETLNTILQTVGLENEGTLLISRYFSLQGKNECRVNGELITLNILRKISSELLDIFGQNDSQLLLDNSNHLSLIDSMMINELQEVKEILSNKLDELSSINDKIKELGGLDKSREDNISLLQFQIDEIESANLEIGMEEEIKSKIKIMQNSEKIHSSLSQSLDVLDGEFNIGNMIKTAINTLSSIDSFNDKIGEEKSRLYSVKYEIDDIVDSLSSIKDATIFNPEELDVLIDRLSQINDLERKYGNTIEDVLNFKENANRKLDILLNADEELKRLKLDKDYILKEILDLSINLHNIRIKNIDVIRDRLITELKKLGMKNANFDVQFLNELTIDNIENIVTVDGGDKCEFMFTANLGVELRPLNKIISGGEMSRFMLAFKSILTSNSQKTCIFDEIDTGIGGEIGAIVGEKICDISCNSQVLCITHLPQIACFGDTNFSITKFDEDNVTKTMVKMLNEEEKVIEIARMLGKADDEISVMHSRNIIQNANSYKLTRFTI